jgi:hypothetical protein
MSVNSTLDHYDNEEYDKQSPTECWKLTIISVYCMILFTCSIVVNATLIVIFLRKKKLISPVNTFVITFTTLSLIGSLTEGPVVIFSNLYCR